MFTFLWWKCRNTGTRESFFKKYFQTNHFLRDLKKETVSHLRHTLLLLFHFYHTNLSCKIDVIHKYFPSKLGNKMWVWPFDKVRLRDCLSLKQWAQKRFSPGTSHKTQRARRCSLLFSGIPGEWQRDSQHETFSRFFFPPFRIGKSPIV